ncbi:50S ribosomal protein L28 [Candidatus Saccharibacteria bacterium]|nr:50S ribosomal protein L28 [Candidatus Saccharibacteria bacterium]
MAICMITGKGKQHGHNVSFSQRRTKKTWSPNMQTKTVVVDGQKLRLKVSAKGIRTLKKKGALGQAPVGKQVTA